ncbi:MAG TPA: hypothetical protein VGD98_08940 [Ktedonobacteraceae bacterium]
MPMKTSNALARSAPTWRPTIEPESPPTETKPRRQESAGWFTRVKNRVKLAMGGDDEDLRVVNTTAVSWHVYHKSHLLGILDPWEAQVFHLRKSGNINARPQLESDAVEYLLIDLSSRIQSIEIYRRQMGESVDIYEMRAA